MADSWVLIGDVTDVDQAIGSKATAVTPSCEGKWQEC